MVYFWGHCQSKIAGLSYSTEDRELGRPELTPLGKCSGVGRIHVEDVAGHQPVEEHAERGQGLLDRGRRKFALEVLHEGSDMEGLHVGELAAAVCVAPLREAPGGVQVRLARVAVVDLGR